MVDHSYNTSEVLDRILMRTGVTLTLAQFYYRLGIAGVVNRVVYCDRDVEVMCYVTREMERLGLAEVVHRKLQDWLETADLPAEIIWNDPRKIR
jgi:hypothetical protein